MAEVHEGDSSTATDGRGTIGLGWRVFQILGLLTALSWLGSYVLFVRPFGWVGGLLSGTLPDYGTVVFDISPIVSVIVILLAVWPRSLRFLQGQSNGAYVLRAIVFVIPALWMVNVFTGTPMVDKLITVPLEGSRMIPLFGGVFLHVVFQHWFQAIAAIAFSLVPDQFEALTASEAPAGIQCAVVECT